MAVYAEHMVASSHKHSAIIIGADILTCVGHVPLFQGRHMAHERRGMHAEWMWANARGGLQPHVPAVG